jgi:nitroreductase
MDYEQFITLVRDRRSVREYKPDPVSDAIINKIIEGGKWAPCAFNIQLLEVVIVKDMSLIEQILDIAGNGFEPPIIQHFGSPALLVILGDSRYCDGYTKGFMQEQQLHEGLAMAIENMMLASAALGLGSVWKTVSPYGGVKIKELLGIPPFYVLEALMPLGYAKKIPAMPPKKDIDIHENRYDINKLKSKSEVEEILKKYCAVPGIRNIRAF